MNYANQTTEKLRARVKSELEGTASWFLKSRDFRYLGDDLVYLKTELPDISDSTLLWSAINRHAQRKISDKSLGIKSYLTKDTAVEVLKYGFGAALCVLDDLVNKESSSKVKTESFSETY